VYDTGAWVEVGGLMSYSANDLEVFRRAAWYVDEILKGAKPAELPVEQPTKFEFVINLKTAKALNLTIPQSVLYRATGKSWRWIRAGGFHLISCNIIVQKHMR